MSFIITGPDVTAGPCSSATTDESYFHFPYFNSLAEELMKAEGKGTIAAFSPTGFSLNSFAHVFHKALLAELLQGDNARLGDAILADLAGNVIPKLAMLQEFGFHGRERGEISETDSWGAHSPKVRMAQPMELDTRA